MSDAKYIVGIDLGTTNSILAYTAADADAREAADIQIKLTEIGTLELWCVSRRDGSRWKLEFNVREKA